MCQTNVDDSIVEKKQLHSNSARNDIRSFEVIMMKMMKSTTYILDTQFTKLNVIDLLLRKRSSESSESIRDASRTARCLRKV